MRLSKPRVDHVKSIDGASALYFERQVPGRDGGALYRFTFSPADGSQAEISARALVTAVTSFYASKYAKEEGFDLDHFSLVKKMDYLVKFAEIHGNTYSVREFVIEKQDLNSGQVLKMIELFVKNFFELNSSYKFNKEPPEKKGCFSDKITFEPYELDKTFHRKYSSKGLR